MQFWCVAISEKAGTPVIFRALVLQLAIAFIFMAHSTSVLADRSLSVPFFSQQDSRWAAKFLDNSSLTIGIYGCALTSAAMVTTYYGLDTDPSRLNDALTLITGIDSNGILHWEKVPEVCNGKITWIGRVNSPDWSRIDSKIDQGHPVIADVRIPSGVQHFIVIWGKVGSNYYFYDPADVSLTNRVWPTGWHGTYTLVGLRIYHGTPLPSTKFSPGDYVKVNSSIGLKIRQTPAGVEITTLDNGSTGEVLSHSDNGIYKVLDGTSYYWWYVEILNKSDGKTYTGWCAENWLENIPHQPPTEVTASDLWYPGGVGSYWIYDLPQGQQSKTVFAGDVQIDGITYQLVEETEPFFGVIDPAVFGYDPFLTFRWDKSNQIWGYGKIANEVFNEIFTDLLQRRLVEAGFRKDIAQIQTSDEWLLLEAPTPGQEWIVMQFEVKSTLGVRGVFKMNARIPRTEKIQTKAGNFNAFVAEYFTAYTIFNEFGLRVANQEDFFLTVWLAAGVGIVQVATSDDILGTLVEYHIEGMTTVSVPEPSTLKDYVRSFIQRETVDKVTVIVEGQQYAIVTLGKYLDPDTLVEYITAEEVKVYVDTEGSLVTDQEIARKIGIIDYIREKQRDGLLDEANDDFTRLTVELRTIGQMPLVEWVIETAETIAAAPLKIKEAVAGKALTQIAQIASKELISLPGKMTKEQLADKNAEFLQSAMNRYDKVRRVLMENDEILDYDVAFSVLESYLWGEAESEMASFLAYRLYYEKYTNSWNFSISELKKILSLELSELTSAAIISLDSQIKWEHEKGDVQYQLHGKAYEATSYTLELAEVTYISVSEYEEKKARIEKVITEIVELILAFWDKISSFKHYLGVILYSPGEIQVRDSQGRITGSVNGEAREEIPDSLYDSESKTVVIFSPSDSYVYEIVGTDEGEYGLGITLGTDGETTTFTAIDIPTTADTLHRYTIDWDALSKGEEGVTIEIDENGDLVPERAVTSDGELTQDEYIVITGVTPKDKYPAIWADLKRTAVFQNYPNPFNPDTWIPYFLAEKTRVIIRIYTATGQLVRTLDLGDKLVGVYASKEKAAHWDGCDDSGESIGSGVFFYTMKAGGFRATRKMVMEK